MTRPMPLQGPAFAAFVAPARRRPALWRLLLGLLIAVLVWIGALAFLLPVAGGEGREDPVAALLAYLGSFAGLAAGVILAAGLLGRRGPATLIGPGGLRARGFGAGAAFVLALLGAATLAGALLGQPPVRRMDVSSWLGALPLALGALLVQTSAEELFFRGYLTQGLAARFRAPVIWLGVPAVLFGALHWAPAVHGPNAGLVAAQAGLIGLILGDVTTRRGNLSLALGMHFANNAVALLLIAQPGPFDGLALFLASAEPMAPAELRRDLLIILAAMSAGYGLWLGWHHRGRR